jgi:hypothetical protein
MQAKIGVRGCGGKSTETKIQNEGCNGRCIDKKCLTVWFSDYEFVEVFFCSIHVVFNSLFEAGNLVLHITQGVSGKKRSIAMRIGFNQLNVLLTQRCLSQVPPNHQQTRYLSHT